MPDNGPLPPLPPTIKIPNIQVQTKVVGELEIPSALPFYYAGVQSIWIWWQVKLELLGEFLGPLGMRPARLGTAGAVNVNFFNAVALYGQGQPGNPGAAGFNETEVNILAYPIAQEKKVPADMTLAQFLAEGDQTKRIGNAGRQLFFENKFLTAYTYDVPSLNNPGQATGRGPPARRDRRRSRIISRRRPRIERLAQGNLERGGGGEAVLQPAGHRLAHHLLQPGRRGGAQRAQCRRFPGEALGHDRLHVLADEGRLAGEHLVQHAAERVDVAPPVQLAVAGRLLRAHVIRRADDHAGGGEA